MNTPKSIPAKFRKHIQFWDDERYIDQGYIVTLVGLAFQDANTNDACHVFGEDTLADMIESLDNCQPCSCDECKKYAPEMGIKL